MSDQLPSLLPVPRSISTNSEQFLVPGALPLVLASRASDLLTSALGFQKDVRAAAGIEVPVMASSAGLAGRPHVLVRADDASVTESEGYRLTISAGGIDIAASTPAGAAYGLATLKQLFRQYGRRLPGLTIADAPDFARRGVMLDISRGKVPTMESLYRFVDMLADLKVNEFQLYTEHTFAYQAHQEVWQHYSPMTGEEILALDRFCRERFIDLVPNQNSFGHLTQWLIHDRYKHMAETLDGWDAWGIHWDDPFSLCPSEPTAIPFLEGLYEELLPHFSSTFFNVGCDETLDVGQGRSKADVAERGHRVYLDFLNKIHALVKARGKTMQFWGDIIIEAPELIPELPKDAVALEWGYEANHPFDEHGAQFAASGIPFYVCPGTSTWMSLAGRTDNAFANLLSAAQSGLKHGAVGYLNTIWGDRGHQDYLPVAYPPLAYGAAVSWGLTANEQVDVRPYLDRTVFCDQGGALTQLLLDLGNVYKEAGRTPPNQSILATVFHAGFDLPGWTMGMEPADFDRAAAAAQACAARLSDLCLTGPDGALIQRELANTVRMLLHACRLGTLRLAVAEEVKPDPAEVRSLLTDLEGIAAEHRLLWLERNRPGGLEQMSMVPFRKLKAAYQALLVNASPPEQV